MGVRPGQAIVLLMLGGAALGAEPPELPTFKAEVNYVEVDALVTDAAGNLVRDLRAEDFEVLEDGKPQALAAFSVVDTPVEREEAQLPARPPFPPDVQDNARAFEGRVYVMVIDDAHTLFGRTSRVKVAARQFIERRLGANDLMAVLHVGAPTDASQEFTSNRERLLRAVDRTLGRKLRSVTAARNESYQNRRDMLRRPSGGIGDPDDAERANDALSSLRVLRDVADWFAGVRGRRKSILFVSEGIDYDIDNVFDNSSATTVRNATREVIAAAARGNASIYSIDPRGLTSLGDEEIEIGSYPDDASLGIGHTSLQGDLQRSQDSLRVLADETGGFAVVNRNDFTDSFARIVRENSTYYMLAYDPPGGPREGSYHRIEVRVKRAGLTVHARKGYATPRPSPAASPATGSTASPALQEALAGPLPLSGIGLSVFASPFRGNGSKASVLLGVEVRGRDLKLDAANSLEVAYLAVDGQGKVRAGSTDRLALGLRPETMARVASTGLRLLSRLELPPGRYQLRVAARDPGAGSVGSVRYDLDVADYSKGPLAISGLAITSAAASQLPSARLDETLKAVLPGPPVALRSFPREDLVAAYAELYEDGRGAPHTVDITATVTGEDGRVVFRTTEEHNSSELRGRGAYAFSARIPVRDLQPGTYVLQVEGRSRLGKGESAVRAVPFTVVATAP
jgi:VWFA-related protein